MWDDAYKKEQDDFKAPEFLKVKTLQTMKEAREKRRSSLMPKLMVGFSFSFFVAVLAFNFFNFNTPVDEPQMVTSLTFERLDGTGWRFGAVTDESMTLPEVEEILGITASNWRLSDFYLQETSWHIDGERVRIQYIFERDGASIQMMLNNYTETVMTNSILNDFPLALYYQVMLLNRTFIAEFLHQDIYHQIHATGLTEDEFIHYLKEIINFLN